MRFADICHTDSTALESGVEVKTLFDCSFAASCQYVLDLDLDIDSDNVDARLYVFYYV